MEKSLTPAQDLYGSAAPQIFDWIKLYAPIHLTLVTSRHKGVFLHPKKKGPVFLSD
jgi:hypothetical protein